MDTAINFVSYLFAGCICIALVIGLGALSWIFATFCEKLYVGCTTSTVPLVTIVDDTARRHIRAMREKQDRERWDRIARSRKTESQPHVVAPSLSYSICDRSGPTYFAGIRFGHHGTNEPRVLFTPLRSMAKELLLQDALKFLNLFDPNHKKLVIELARPELAPSQKVELGKEIDVTSELLAMGGIE